MPKRKQSKMLKFPVREPLKLPGDIVATDVVMWGLIDGDARVPDFLASRRQLAQIVLEALPEATQARLTLVRTYVTVQMLEGRRRLPKLPRRAVS